MCADIDPRTSSKANVGRGQPRLATAVTDIGVKTEGLDAKLPANLDDDCCSRCLCCPLAP